MKSLKIAAMAVLTAMASVSVFTPAMAFCGTVEATESAPTQQQALNKANKQGLRETRKLDQQYGASVQYEQAQVQCGEFDLGVTCTITQRFCVNEASAAPDENGVNSPVCQRIFSACNRGDAKSCAVYEEQCQND